MQDDKEFLKNVFTKIKTDYTLDGVVLDFYLEDLELCIIFYKDKKDKEKEKEIIKVLSKKVYDDNGCYKDYKFCERFVKVIHIKESEFYKGFRKVLAFMDNSATFGITQHF